MTEKPPHDSFASVVRRALDEVQGTPDLRDLQRRARRHRVRRASWTGIGVMVLVASVVAPLVLLSPLFPGNGEEDGSTPASLAADPTTSQSPTADPGETASAPRTPSPNTGTPGDFTALWPEQSREAVQEAQADVDSGRDRWRLDAFAAAAGYASHVLGWLGADPEPCFLTANCVGSPADQARVYVYQSLPCNTAGNPDCMIAIVHLERLIRTGPTGIWSVTDVEVRVDEGGKVGPAGSSAGIVFVLEPEYRTGETVEVKIRNVGTTTYLYQSFYQACFLTYIDASGREFIIPPGTHCDILSEADIAPGETKTLFIWKLDECTKDAWGCQESATLPPGEYTIRGSFVPKGGGIPAMAEITFMIQR